MTLPFFPLAHPMDDTPFQVIDISLLKPGMFVELELGWMAHPFPTSSFKLTSTKQIDAIRSLGLQQVRVNLGKSEVSETPSASVQTQADALSARMQATPQMPDPARSAALAQARLNKELLNAQQRDLLACERRYAQTMRQYKQVLDQVQTHPAQMKQQCQEVVQGFVSDILATGETAIRLLSDGMGDKVAMHPVNVCVLCLLLGKYMGLSATEMEDLGMAAFLHDIGKIQLPDRVRWLEDSFSAHEQKLYQEHVKFGRLLATHMALSPEAVQAIEQHHEMMDGSGFPRHLQGDALSRVAKILALVNHYDGMCNPTRATASLTPHEAIALIFAHLKPRFDPLVVTSFIRMMGVYPPGSIVQMVDQRYAMVVSVNAERPLKPRVIVFDPKVSKHEALILNLECAPELGIRRSLKPTALPRAAMDYLSPRQRICYFFERAVTLPIEDTTP